MSISFHCECGKPLRSKPEMAGRKTKCPHCGVILMIPGTPVAAASAVANGTSQHDSGPSFHGDALRVEGLDWSSPNLPTSPAETKPRGDSSAQIPTAPAVEVPSRPDPPRPADGSKQYKILSQRDHSVTGKLNCLHMEEVLNEQAHLGWVMKTAFVVNVPGHAGNHDEVVLILER